jgi:polynucleotide 5'-triphosphatase
MDSDKAGHPSTPVSYTHLHLVDSYYPSESPRDRDKIRVTRDERSGEVRETTKKIKLGNLDIYCPKRVADWRVSVNLEVPCTVDLG